MSIDESQVAPKDLILLAVIIHRLGFFVQWALDEGWTRNGELKKISIGLITARYPNLAFNLILGKLLVQWSWHLSVDQGVWKKRK